jgi:GT2 family glycosyltransferase
LLLEHGAFARVLRVSEPRFYETANVFYRRADLEDAGGFDEALSTGEDTDLALRVRARGDGVLFAEDALVYHDIRPSQFVAAARETLRWTDLPRVIRLHPDMRRQLLYGRYFWKASHPRAMAAAFGIALAAARRRPAPLLLVLPWLHFRVSSVPLCPGRRRRWLVLPGGLAIDLIEVGVMIRGSLRHRVLVL